MAGQAMAETTSQADIGELNIREQIARIDKLLAEIQAQPQINQQRQAQIAQAQADADRKRQEMRFAPWQVAFAGMTAGAAVFAAGGVFVKFLGF
jgi:hypothetical protein